MQRGRGSFRGRGGRDGRGGSRGFGGNKNYNGNQDWGTQPAKSTPFGLPEMKAQDEQEKSQKRNNATGFKRRRDTQENSEADYDSANKDRHKVCFNCRKTGHRVQDCPDAPGNKTTCYNCGGEHRLRDCPEPKEGGLKFATCFICSEVGHIASKCPKSDHGIYINGGACRFCQGVDHLARDCPVKVDQAVERKKSRTNHLGGDDDDIDRNQNQQEPEEEQEDEKPKKPPTKKTTKVVSF
eukprot:TRINITY_DN5260_c0_g1_i1.p1 TRINITY_DN5260_c0_g1~~TRINITY_DN5260_c0_g1_i1.p1  ORF type:complete len:239 (+),score=37.91 TRINITY_DN5260_c0_g1_i1:111-827(+)